MNNTAFIGVKAPEYVFLIGEIVATNELIAMTEGVPKFIQEQAKKRAAELKSLKIDDIDITEVTKTLGVMINMRKNNLI